MKLKHYYFAIVSLLLCHQLNGQVQDNIYIEIDVVQRIRSEPIYSRYEPQNKFTVLNGIRFGINDYRGLSPFISFSRFDFNEIYGNGFTAFDSDAVGYELEFGVLKNIYTFQNLTFSIGSEVFYERVGFSGLNYSDVGPSPYAFSHQRSYTGIGLILRVNYKIIRNFGLSLNLRNRFGRVDYSEPRFESLTGFYPRWLNNFLVLDLIGINYSF